MSKCVLNSDNVFLAQKCWQLVKASATCYTIHKINAAVNTLNYTSIELQMCIFSIFFLITDKSVFKIKLLIKGKIKIANIVILKLSPTLDSKYICIILLFV